MDEGLQILRHFAARFRASAGLLTLLLFINLRFSDIGITGVVVTCFVEFTVSESRFKDSSAFSNS